MVAGLSGASFRWLPIVERELRVSARQKGLHWGRLFSVGVALIVFSIMMLVVRGFPPEMQGVPIFAAIMFLVMLQSLFAGLGMLDCISKEKREGTLGLLFLTSLGGVDVVMGKMTAGSMKMIYRMLAFLPIVAVTFLMGGVERTMFLTAVFECFSTALFSLCLAACCSAMVRSFWAGFGLWLAGMLVLCVGFVLIDAPIEFLAYFFGYDDASTWVHGFRSISPMNMYEFSSPSQYAFVTLGSVARMLFSLGLFLGACRSTVKSLKGEETKAPRRPLFGKAAVKPAPAKVVQIVKEGPKDLSPMYWLINRYRSTKVIAVRLILAGMAVLFVFWLSQPEYERSLGWGVFLVSVAHLAVVFWMAAEAAAWTCKLRQSGELELLLTTPMTVKEFWKGYHKALFCKSIVPVILLFFAYWCFATSTSGQYSSVGEWLGRMLLIVMIGLQLPLNLLAAGWTGACFGAFAKNELQAALSATAMVLGMCFSGMLLFWFGLPLAIYCLRWVLDHDTWFHWRNYFDELYYGDGVMMTYLVLAVGWGMLLRSSLVYFFWSRRQCLELRHVVQAEGLQEKGWKLYLRVFLQALYRRPKPLLEVTK